jgi:hypothetical protein
MEKIQPQETSTTTQAPDEHDHQSDTPQGRMADLLVKVPRLAAAAAIFFTITPLLTPDTIKGPHSN